MYEIIGGVGIFMWYYEGVLVDETMLVLFCVVYGLLYG